MLHGGSVHDVIVHHGVEQTHAAEPTLEPVSTPWSVKTREMMIITMSTRKTLRTSRYVSVIKSPHSGRINTVADIGMTSHSLIII